MNLNKQIFTMTETYILNRRMTPKGIVWHSTGANNPRLSRYVQPDDGKLGKNPNGNAWNVFRPAGRKVSVHGFLGKLADGSIATYQVLPWDQIAWHVGGSANNTHIGIEICEDDLKSRDYFNAVYREAVEVSAHLCKLYSWNPQADGVIIDHADAYRRGWGSNHGDVKHWFSKYGKTLADFRNDIAEELKKERGDLTMSQYKELKELIDKQAALIDRQGRTIVELEDRIFGRNQTPNNWRDFEEAWKRAQDQMIMDGKNPRHPVTREQLAAIFFRMGLL